MPHIHDKIDFTAEVMIVYKNTVLLRKHDKYKKWLSVGGHIELDEEPPEAAVREVKEEVGLDVELFNDNRHPLVQLPGYKSLLVPEFMNRHRINDKHDHISFVYLARAKTDQMKLSETEVSEGCKWFTLEDLQDPQYELSDQIKLYAETALKKLGTKN